MMEKHVLGNTQRMIDWGTKHCGNDLSFQRKLNLARSWEFCVLENHDEKYLGALAARCPSSQNLL